MGRLEVTATRSGGVLRFIVLVQRFGWPSTRILCDPEMPDDEDAKRERKVAPIYNALDAGNYRGALKLASQKGHQHWDIVKVLRAIALERLGRPSEALALCLEVQADRPTSESVLRMLGTALKFLDRVDQSVVCFEGALDAQPQHEGHARQLFFSLVRSREPAKQQQTALRLYKLTRNVSYLHWAALSMIQQTLRSPAAAAAGKLMAAERIMEQSSGPRPSTAEELQLYVHLLREQGKHAERRATLRTHTGSMLGLSSADAALRVVPEREHESESPARAPKLFQPLDANVMHAELAHEGAQWRVEQATYLRLLAHRPEQWSFHTKYLDALFRTLQNAPGASVDAMLISARCVSRQLADRTYR